MRLEIDGYLEKKDDQDVDRVDLGYMGHDPKEELQEGHHTKECRALGGNGHIIHPTRDWRPQRQQ